MKIDAEKFKKIHGYEEAKGEALDRASMEKALSYKKEVLKNFTAIRQHDILSRFTGDQYWVTRKYDGEYAILFHDNGQTVTVNRSGRIRRGIPCIEEADALIRNSGIRQGIFPAEIYVDAAYKTRVNDLIHALAHESELDTLRLAVFDVLEIDGHPVRGGLQEKVARYRANFRSGNTLPAGGYVAG
ncbi:MAG: hypothetical protein LUD68_04400, partial [Rikenellaceae bacterium]|nr:hypothetical protein [Rikenellaceae bacterium]